MKRMISSCKQQFNVMLFTFFFFFLPLTWLSVSGTLQHRIYAERAEEMQWLRPNIVWILSCSWLDYLCWLWFPTCGTCPCMGWRWSGCTVCLWRTAGREDRAPCYTSGISAALPDSTFLCTLVCGDSQRWYFSPKFSNCFSCPSLFSFYLKVPLSWSIVTLEFHSWDMIRTDVWTSPWPSQKKNVKWLILPRWTTFRSSQHSYCRRYGQWGVLESVTSHLKLEPVNKSK